MTNLNLPAFYLGIQEELQKFAAFDVSSMPLNENILPTLSSQAKWKYVRTKDGLKLSDGNLVYSFGGIPSDLPHEDTPVSRLANDNILDFEKDSVGKGTAQIHRSSPDSIYMTLADGSQNPTFMLNHEGGQQWRYSPSKKFVEKLKKMREQALSPGAAENVSVEPSALIDAASDMGKQAVDFSEALADAANQHDFQHAAGHALSNLRSNPNPLNLQFNIHRNGMFDPDSLAEYISNKTEQAGNLFKGYTQHAAEHPIAATLASYGLAKGISTIKDKLHPDEAMKRELDPQASRNHEMMIGAGAVLPTLASMAIMAK
jgi:hypothetical protein